jgi:hypothetical protein
VPTQAELDILTSSYPAASNGTALKVGGVSGFDLLPSNEMNTDTNTYDDADLSVLWTSTENAGFTSEAHIQYVDTPSAFMTKATNDNHLVYNFLLFFFYLYSVLFFLSFPSRYLVNGFTEKDCLDSQKKTEEQLMRELHDWIQLADEHTLLGQNVYTDKEFLNEAFSRNGIKFKFNHRIIDTHSVAYAEHLRTGKIIPHKYEDQTQSALNLDKILQSVGIPEEPRPHNALTGAKVSAEAFYRLVYNKKLLPEFEEYSIPTEIIC